MNNSTTKTASDVRTIQLEEQINLYYPPLLIVVGTIGNIISFLIYIQKKYRHKSHGIYILTLSIVDTTMLWIGLFQYWLLFNFFPKALTVEHCHGMFFVVNLIANISHWIIVFLTVDRFIAVIFPMKYSVLSTSRNIKINLAVISLTAFAKNFHYLWTTEFIYNDKTGTAICAFGVTKKGPWITMYQWFELIISSLLPFVIILTGNIFIIITLKTRHQKMDVYSKTKSLIML